MSDRSVARVARRIAHLPVGAAWRTRRLCAKGVARRYGSGVVLYYHRVASPSSDPWRLAVTPQTFDRQLAFLASECTPLPLAEMVAAGRRGRLPRRAVAITFDDGYVDNLEQALPVLRRHGLPATIYVATGYVGNAGRYWWDELHALLCGPGERPSEIELSVGGTRVSAPTETPEQRERALSLVVQPAFRASSPFAIEEGLRAVHQWASLDAEPDTPSEPDEGRPVDREELERLGSDDLIELGAHTARHPSLPVLAPDAQLAEIEASRDYLAEVTGSPPPSFSYPFGDNDLSSRRMVRRAGFDHAVGIREHMPLTRASSRWAIPRAMAFEESDDAFAERFERILGFRG